MLVKSVLLTLSLLVNPFSGKGPTVGHKALDFTLKTVDGKNITLSDFRGQVVLLDFWASWCGPCKEEMPYLTLLQKTYGKDGFTVLAVNIDNESKNALKFLKEHSIRLPLILDEKKRVVSAYDVQAMPTTMIIDQKGWIRYVHSGFEAEKFPLYKQQIEKLLKEGKSKTARKRRAAQRKG